MKKERKKQTNKETKKERKKEMNVGGRNGEWVLQANAFSVDMLVTLAKLNAQTKERKKNFKWRGKRKEENLSTNKK